MGFFDTIVDSAKASAHDYGVQEINKVTGTGVAAPTANEQATNIPPSGQVSPKDPSASLFSPKGFIAYVKANPVKGGLACLALIAVGVFAYRKFVK